MCVCWSTESQSGPSRNHLQTFSHLYHSQTKIGPAACGGGGSVRGQRAESGVLLSWPFMDKDL